MPSNAWAEVDARILAALDPTEPRRPRVLELDLALGIVIPALRQLAREGLVATHGSRDYTTYTITEAGLRRLADTKAMA